MLAEGGDVVVTRWEHSMGVKSTKPVPDNGLAFDHFGIAYGLNAAVV